MNGVVGREVMGDMLGVDHRGGEEIISEMLMRRLDWISWLMRGAREERQSRAILGLQVVAVEWLGPIF